MKDNVYSVGESYEKKDYTTLALPKGEYETCRFVHCNFEKADLSSIKFIECEFKNCNLSLVKPKYSRFMDVQFTECKLIGVDWTTAHWSGYSLFVK